jgi:sialate O-acetylesterase
MRRLKVSSFFSDGMILQHGVSVPISGESLPMSQITLSFMGKEYSAPADGSGKWLVLLDSHSPGGPYSMEISASAGASSNETDAISIKDIYLGDVWLCSGQSNMELPMRRVKDDFPQEWDPPINPLIRQFSVPQEWDFSGPRQRLSGGSWTAACAETLDEFSAAAWFFARQIFETCNYPIGIILAAWGGTPVEAWMSADALAAFPEKIAIGKKYADSAFCDALIRKRETLVETWNNELTAADSGLTQAWQKPQTDICAWDEISLPGDFAKACKTGQADLTGFCGVIWLCREFEVDESFAAAAVAQEARVWLGTITDADTVYINGVELGNTTYRYPPRKYAIPAGVMRKGKNRVVIRVVCSGGDGGITPGKPFRIFSPASDSIIELSGTWKYRIGESAGLRPQEFFIHCQPMGLFNAMIAPLLGYPCRGVLWYQGESNGSNPNEYASLFISMINDWREKYQSAHSSLLIPHSSLPFLFVQLPIFGEPEDNNESDSWAIIRAAQLSALSLPLTGMAAALEFGEWNDLHPVNKKGVGGRLALAAEKLVFKKQNTAPGPLLRSVSRGKGRLLLCFDNCGKGLIAGETPYLSVISGSNIFRIPAVIESPECLSADISDIRNPEKVLYAWAANPRDRQLYNSDGLPVIPFRAGIGEPPSGNGAGVSSEEDLTQGSRRRRVER